MKKVLSLMLACIVLLVMSTGVMADTGRVAKSGFIPNIPDFHQADRELLASSKDKVRAATTDRYKTLGGKAYFKPQQTGTVENLKREGEMKTIAILVDFPVKNTEGKISDVPGVDYDRIPADKFKDLLSGETYNPYDLDMFKHLATFEGKDYYGNPVPLTAAPINRTLPNYYKEVSYGKFSASLDVVGWYELPHDYDYYMGQNLGYTNENGYTNIAELIKDAIELADKDVDFSKYAVDAKPGDFADLYGDAASFEYDGKPVNKIVPNIVVIHRGTGAEYNLDPHLIWSHKFDLLSAEYWGYYDRTGGEYMPEEDLAYVVKDGVVLNGYNACPEVGQDINGYLKVVYPDIFPSTYTGRKPSPPYVGVYCHEFGHGLGLPDQYDYGYDSNGTGGYTLMASGSGSGHIDTRYYWDNTPVHIDAWSKVHLGFAEPKVVNPSSGKQTLTLRPVAKFPDIYQILVPGSNGREYFLLENRQQIGYDEGLACNPDAKKLHGLEVYHFVNDIYSRNPHRPNEAQNYDNDHLGKSQQGVDYYTGTNESHYAFSVIQADGRYELETGASSADAGDLFPGKYGVTGLSANINNGINTASVYKWDSKSTYTGISIQNVVEHPDGTITCDVYFDRK